MVTLEQIEQLEAFESMGARVLSLYLKIEPASQIRRSYRIDLEDLLKEAREKLDESTRADFATEAAKVQAWLDGQPQPRGKGLAVFSCSSRGFWRADFLAVPVMNHVTFEPRPDVAPLLELIDEYERYAVAVVDKEKARLFTVFAGEIEESEHFKDFVFGKSDDGAATMTRRPGPGRPPGTVVYGLPARIRLSWPRIERAASEKRPSAAPRTAPARSLSEKPG